MRLFECFQVQEAIAHALAGGQALHVHSFVTDDAPACFRNAVARGEDIAHLFDQDKERLWATAYNLGVRVIVIEHQNTARQHVDLCQRPLQRALALANETPLFPDERSVPCTGESSS